MTEKELIEKLCIEGTASVKKREKGSKLKGGIKGFELANGCSNIDEVEKLMRENHDKDVQARIDHDAEKITIDDYWCQRYITLQLEYIYNVLRVGRSQPGDMNYASSVIRYGQAVGVKGELA